MLILATVVGVSTLTAAAYHYYFKQPAVTEVELEDMKHNKHLLHQLRTSIRDCLSQAGSHDDQVRGYDCQLVTQLLTSKFPDFSIYTVKDVKLLTNKDVVTHHFWLKVTETGDITGDYQYSVYKSELVDWLGVPAYVDGGNQIIETLSRGTALVTLSREGKGRYECLVVP